MSGPLRRRAAGVTVALLLAITGAGCSSDSEDSADDSPSASPSSASPTPSITPSPSPSETPEPVRPEAPPAQDSDKGREAFARFVIDSWSYALATNKASALSDLSPKSGLCLGCAELRTELMKRTKQGWYVDFPGARVVKVDVNPGEEPGTHVALAKINVPASTSYFEDGEIRNENESRKGATFEVRMRLDGKQYSLLAFRVT